MATNKIPIILKKILYKTGKSKMGWPINQNYT
jgi:hypothetical protein